MKLSSFFAVIVTSTLIFLISHLTDSFRIGRILRAPAIIHLTGIGTDTGSMHVVESNRVSEFLPDSMIAEGARTNNGWDFRIRFEKTPYMIVQIQTQDGIVLRDIVISSGDTLFIERNDDGVRFSGGGSADNTLFQENFRLFEFGSVPDESPSAMRKYLDTRLDSRLDLLKRKFADGRYSDTMQETLVGALYCQWAAPQAMHLARKYFPDRNPATTPTDEELAFLTHVPDMSFRRWTYSHVLADFLRDCYIDRILTESHAQKIDTTVIRRTLEIIGERHVGSMRCALEFSVLEWIVNQRIVECYRLIEEGIESYELLSYVIDMRAPALQLLENAKSVLKGATAPKFQAMDIDGKPVRLGALGGRPVVIYFWGTWCGPCRVKMPAIARLMEEVREAGVQWVFIAQEWGAIQNWRDFVLDNGLGGIQIGQHSSATDALAKLFLVRQYPTTFIIDRTGKILDNNASWIGDADAAARLKRLLAL